MAIVQYDPLETPLWGREKGSLFSKGRSGFYAKNNAKRIWSKTNRDTTFQVALHVAARRWATGLSDFQRSAWSDLAASTVWVDPVGVSYSPNGSALYSRTNSFLALYGLPFIDLAPASAECLFYAKVYRWDSASGRIFAASPAAYPSDFRGFFGVSRPLRRTVARYEGPYSFNESALGSLLGSGSSISGPGVFSQGDLVGIWCRDMAPDGSLSGPVFDLFTCEPVTMSTLHFQVPAYTFQPGFAEIHFSSGNVLLARPTTGNAPVMVVAKPFRITDIAVYLRTGTVVGVAVNVQLSIWKNYPQVWAEYIPGSIVSNSDVFKSWSGIVGLQYLAGDHLSGRLVRSTTAGQSLPISNVLIYLTIEHGDFS